MSQYASPMTLEEFTKIRREFDARARLRWVDRVNSGFTDVTHEVQVLEEMIIASMEANAALAARIEKLEKILNPEE